MYISQISEMNRRSFIHRAGALGIAGASSSYALGLAGLGDLAAQTQPKDYKALVCIFLFGGNDHANTLIPCDPVNYGRYSAIRGGSAGVAIAQQQLTALRHPDDQTLTDDLRYALAPSMPNMTGRFNEGKMATLLNVGPLLAPLTRAQYDSENIGSFPRPDKLFSHNDQQSTWQAFAPERARFGWGGKLGDLMMASNQNAMFTAISTSGNAVFLNGDKTTATTITPYSPIKMYSAAGTSTYSKALSSLLKQQSQNILENDYARMNARSIEYSEFIADSLSNSPDHTKFGEQNGISGQLSVVARLIAARQQMGVTRQIFFVSMGGFDNHDDLKSNHQGLLAALDGAVGRFYSSIKQLGLEDAVTTFTASDFGRTLSYNGDGTDHGWGSHHFIIGGAVKGGRYYGRAPSISVTSDDQVGRGRLLPTTSVDEYASTLALWFGVPASQLATVAPNINRFASPNLGFMRLPGGA
jgi:uncharacterized protein (DUF1501 family)